MEPRQTPQQGQSQMKPGPPPCLPPQNMASGWEVEEFPLAPSAQVPTNDRNSKLYFAMFCVFS
ncbi:hypothetical protein INR49_013833 [Caranx melampygus]|nr:hypothetical protein INR49_013833 [Caranx melampygus]